MLLRVPLDNARDYLAHEAVDVVVGALIVVRYILVTLGCTAMWMRRCEFLNIDIDHFAQVACPIANFPTRYVV